MPHLERRLRALAPDAFPPTPHVAAAVAARIAGEPPPRRRTAMRRRTLAVALALVLLPAGAVAAVPGTRHAILDWLGLAHVRVERVPRLPALPVRQRVDLGERVASAEAATRRAGFAVAVPRTLGRPDGVHVASGGVVSLAYGPRPGLPRDPRTGLGLLVTELRALARPEYLAKAAGPGTRVEAVRVAGAPGVFLSGAPHELTIEQPRGVIRQVAPRLAGNALAFERAGLVIAWRAASNGAARWPWRGA
ncbi:MAG: hypothetical protein QOJ63_2563 [Solirubrobacteraceae bacterium]|jgi:hypothetical protein|nr:hypothetical protein [Solirubrobacteraceae bacterium]